MNKAKKTFVFIVFIVTLVVAAIKFWSEIISFLKKVKDEYGKRVDEDSPIAPERVKIKLAAAKKQVVKAAQKEAKKVEKELKAQVKAVKQELSERQQEIWALVKKIGNKKFTLAEIAASFPHVTTRTLRRDMEALEKKKSIKQRGSTKNVYYEVL
jgi:DNA-directed RNA polymerase specialized sigma subunit